jgi:hypothetical protein
MTVEGVDAELAAGLNLGEGFHEMPVIEWQATRDGNGMIFSAGRRLEGDKVWVRITEMNFPNFVATASLVPTAAQLRHTGVAMSRWQVPVSTRSTSSSARPAIEPTMRNSEPRATTRP